MKIGEIKAHSIILICPEVQISYDRNSEESIVDAIENLKCDPNIRDIALGCVPSINRAFSIIEARGGSKTRCIKKQLKATEGKIKLSEIAQDVLSVSRVYFDGRMVSFEGVCDDEIYLDIKNAGEYTFVYKSKIERISEATSDFADVSLSEGIAEIIPYFVKSDIIAGEDKEGAMASKLLFDSMLTELLNRPIIASPSVETVYCFE